MDGCHPNLAVKNTFFKEARMSKPLVLLIWKAVSSFACSTNLIVCDVELICTLPPSDKTIRPRAFPSYQPEGRDR